MDHREHLPIGAELVGDYRIEGVLGDGGFGITYKAWHLGLKTFVAVKEYFPTEFATRDETLTIRSRSAGLAEMFEWGRKRFLEEAQTLAKFRHPSIVRVLHVFEALNSAYMVLEYEEGQSLRHWLDDLGRPATQAELDTIVPPLLDALAEMHAADFIHRDIAPDNIIVRPDHSPVLLDFGAARQAIAAETKTLTGIIKAGYSPPEQYLTNAGLQGPWTDIYALGATLYHVVTGAAPPEAPARQLGETLVPASSASKGDFRPAFLEAIDWALQINIQERPQSVSAFREALSDTLTSSKATPPGPASKPPHRKSNTALKWASVLLVIVTGIVGYFVYDQFPSQQQQRAKNARIVAELAAEKARDAEAQRREKERLRADAARHTDETAWRTAKNIDTLAAYRTYLRSHPKGIFADAARGKIASLDAAARGKADAARKRREQARGGAGRRTAFISIGTGGVTGVYYPTGGAICRLVNKMRAQTGIRCSSESTGGSIYNINTIRAGELEFGIAQSDWQHHAYHGTSRFRGNQFKKLRAVFSVHPEPVTVIASVASGIRTFTDLKGKRVNIGNPGSGTRYTWERMEAAFGWRRSDLKLAAELRSSQTAQAVCDGKLDAYFWLVGHPSALTQESLASCAVRLVQVSGHGIDRLVADNPYYRKTTIPARMYNNRQDIKTFGVGATFVTSADASDFVVYSVVKAVFDNFEQFRKLHPAFRRLKAQEMIRDSLSAPLHPGAIKYYKERGWM